MQSADICIPIHLSDYLCFGLYFKLHGVYLICGTYRQLSQYHPLSSCLYRRRSLQDNLQLASLGSRRLARYFTWKLKAATRNIHLRWFDQATNSIASNELVAIVRLAKPPAFNWTANTEPDSASSPASSNQPNAVTNNKVHPDSRQSTIQLYKLVQSTHAEISAGFDSSEMPLKWALRHPRNSS